MIEIYELAVTPEVKNAALIAYRDLKQLCLSTSSLRAVWLKISPALDSASRAALLSETKALLPGAKLSPINDNMIKSTLRGVFPSTLRGLVADLAACPSRTIHIELCTFKAALSYWRIFATGRLIIRLREEPLSFDMGDETLQEEKFFTAYASLLKLLHEITQHVIAVDTALNIDIDGKPFPNGPHSLRKLILILAALGNEFTNEEFCKAYDKKSVEHSKECHRHLRRLQGVIPSLDWSSASGVKTLSGFCVRFRGDRSAVVQEIEKFLQTKFKSDRAHVHSNPSHLLSKSQQFPSGVTPASAIEKPEI